MSGKGALQDEKAFVGNIRVGCKWEDVAAAFASRGFGGIRDGHMLNSQSPAACFLTFGSDWEAWLSIWYGRVV